MIILGVDLGKVRTGLAVCDRGEMLASPAGVIAECSRERLADKISAVAKERGAELLVLGLLCMNVSVSCSLLMCSLLPLNMQKTGSPFRRR